MRIWLTLCSLLFLSTIELRGQNFQLRGLIISEEFEVLNGAVIQTTDSTFLGRADDKGYFNIDVPEGINELQIWFVAMESETIQISRTCNFLEVILLNDMIVEFETVKEMKQRYTRLRKQLPELYRRAFEQGVFKDEKPCR